jgi:hypothetical protein
MFPLNAIIMREQLNVKQRQAISETPAKGGGGLVETCFSSLGRMVAFPGKRPWLGCCLQGSVPAHLINWEGVAGGKGPLRFSLACQSFSFLSLGVSRGERSEIMKGDELVTSVKGLRQREVEFTAQ